MTYGINIFMYILLFIFKDLALVAPVLALVAPVLAYYLLNFIDPYHKSLYVKLNSI